MNKSHQNQIRLMPPLDGIIENIDKRLEELEKKHNLLDKRVIHFEQLASEIMGKLKKAGIELRDPTRV